MKVRLVLLPEYIDRQNLKKESFQLSKQFKTFFTLDAIHIPHVTILPLEFEDIYLKDVLNIMKQLVGENDFAATADGMKDYGGGYVGVHLKETEEIAKLYAMSLQAFQVTCTVTEHIFAPHITVTRMKHEFDTKNPLVISAFASRRIAFPYVALCEEGDNGTCIRIIKKYSTRLKGGENI